MKQPARHRPKYRLSPNEVEQLKKEETEKRRKLRIVQVREQAKAAAAKIRKDVKQEKDRQLLKLAQEIQTQLEDEKREEVQKLEKQYENTLRTIGQAHSQAQLTDKSISHAQQQQTALENKRVAEARHREALRKLALEKAYKEYDETKHLRDRHAALEEEKKRAAEVASRPPPPPDQVAAILDEKSKISNPIPLTDVNAFSTTHYHMPDFAVQRAPPEQQFDAKSAGEDEDFRTKEELAALKKKQHDQLVMARIRGNEALKKEKLKHEYDDLMADLSVQQKADRRRRQVVVSKLPKQVFLPPDRRIEELEEKQLEMERAFEDMYMHQINLSGNLSLTLDPNPVPASPGEDDKGGTPASEGSPTVLPTLPPLNPALRELTNISRTQGQPPQQGNPETVLKKLLNRIKEQRSEVEAEKSQQADAGPEAKVTDSRRQQSDRVTSSRGRASAKGPRAPSPVQPDPLLDLSPLRAAGNQKPQRSAVQREEEVEMTDATDDSEACFLDRLKGRLDAIDAQKEYLDQRMKQHQQQHQQQQQQRYTAFSGAAASQPLQQPFELASQPLPTSSQHTLTKTSTALAAPVLLQTADLVRERDRALNVQREQLAAPSSSVPYTVNIQREDSAAVSRSVPCTLSQPVPETGRQMGSTAMTAGSRTNLLGPVGDGFPSAASGPGFVLPGRDRGHIGVPGLPTFSAQATAAVNIPQSAGLNQPFSGLGYRSASQLPASSGYPPMAVGDGQFSASANRPAGLTQAYSGAGLGLGTLGGGLSSSLGPTSMNGLGGSMGQVSVPGGTGYPGLSASAGVPPSRPSVPMSSVGLTAPGGVAVSGLTATHPLGSSMPLPSMTSQLTGRQFQPLSTSLSSSQIGRGLGTSLADTGDQPAAGLTSVHQQGAGAERAEMVYSSLAARLASGLREEDRLKHVREYQRQLVEKHEQRMKALADARAKIENRQTDTGVQSVSQSLLSTSGQGVNDPATLVPYTLRTSALPAESFSSSALPRSSVVSGGEDVSSTTREPILAGSFGMSVSGDSRWQQLNQEKKSGVPVTAAADWGDRGAAAASKLDSVRKSLPFDNPDETLHREDADGEAGDTDGVSLADDSHISSSTDRGSPALGSRSYKSSGSGHSGSLGSGMSGGSISGSSLVARAEEKRISFEQRQRELQDQLAEIQRQKDLLLQRYHGNQERVSAQEESVRSKLRAAQAATSSVAGGSALTRPQPTGSAGAFGLTSDLPSSGPSMELEEGSLSSERLSQRPGVRSWAMELEEFSATQDKSGDRSSRTPGDLTLEEISITSEREWSGGRRARDGDRSGETEQRPTSSLSSLQEASFGNGMNSARSLSVEELSPFSLTAVSNENLAPALTSYTGAQSQSSQDRVASARSSTEVENMLQELARAGSVGAGISWSSLFTSGQSVLQEDPNQNGGSADDFTRLPPPPTRQPIPVTQYEPHELSTILEVDTPQTGSKTITATGGSPSTTRQAPGAAVGSETAGGSEKTGARRFIDFGKHGTTTAPDDDKASESKFSASGSSASSDVRSVIEVIRPGMLRTSATRAGVEMERADPGLNEKGDFRIVTSGFVSLQQQQGQSVSNPKPNLSLLSSFQPRDTEALPGSHDTSQASSARGFHPLNLTLDSLTSRSLSMEDSRARRFLDFSDTESAAVGTTTAGAGSEGGGGRGQPADEVLRQARKFNQDLMAAIQQQAADVFDQSSQSTLSVSHSAADASHGSGLSQR